MPRDLEKFTKKWQAKLAHAHVMWGEQGLIAERLGSTKANGPKAEEIWKYLRHYRLDGWDGSWGGIDKRNLAVTTLGFAAYNTWSAGLLARHPRAQVLPRLRTGSQHATEVAKDALMVEALLNYDIQTQKMKRQYNRALFSSFFSPLGGVIRHGFTPTEEFYADDKGEKRMERYAPAVPDRPWIRNVKSWDIRIDPTAATWEPDEDAEWVAFRQIRTIDDIKANPKLVNRRDLKPNIRLGTSAGKMRERELKGLPDTQWFESWVIYEKRERTWFEIADRGMDKPLREPSDWPLPWKDLPYDILQFNEQMDTAFQVPYMQSVIATLIERNKLRTMMGELVKRLRRVIVYNAQALGQDEEGKLTGADLDLAEWIECKGDPAGAISQTQVGGLDTTLIAYDAQLQADIREALGQSQMDRAQRANVETAAESNSIQQGSAISSGRNQERIEDFLGSSIRHYAIARQAVTERSEMIPLLGVEDTRILDDHLGTDYFEVSPEQLRGEWDFEIVAGSTLQRNRQSEVALAMSDIQVASGEILAPVFNQRQLAVNYAVARGLNPTSVLMTMNAMQKTSQIGGPQLPGANGGGGQRGGVDPQAMDIIANLERRGMPQ
jgi:hypothetical protein